MLTHSPDKLAANENSWLVLGHVHNNTLREFPSMNSKAKTINVGVDVTKFFPVNLNWIINLIETENNYLYLPSKIA